MIFEETYFKLKDGRDAIIRSPKDEDINGLIDYLKLSSAETHFIIREAEECEKYTYELEKDLIDGINSSKNSLMLVCVVDGKVAGNCQLDFKSKIKVKHRAEIGIALIKEFWGQGIGTKLFETMIEIAKEREEVMQLELGVVEGNDRARHLYEKMGFKISGVHPDAIRLKDGTMLNEYLMIKKIDR